MALIAVLDKAAQEVSGSTRTNYGRFSLTGTYTTNGIAITPRQFGLKALHQLAAYPSQGYVFVWDQANSKLLVYYSDNNAIADGPLIQVPNGADLTVITVANWKAVGL
jgi:hypothetical protein